jgi:hypothetical protein
VSAFYSSSTSILAFPILSSLHCARTSQHFITCHHESNSAFRSIIRRHMTDEMQELPFLPCEAGCTKVREIAILCNYILIWNSAMCVMCVNDLPLTRVLHLTTLYDTALHYIQVIIANNAAGSAITLPDVDAVISLGKMRVPEWRKEQICGGGARSILLSYAFNTGHDHSFENNRDVRSRSVQWAWQAETTPPPPTPPCH